MALNEQRALTDDVSPVAPPQASGAPDAVGRAAGRGRTRVQRAASVWRFSSVSSGAALKRRATGVVDFSRDARSARL